MTTCGCCACRAAALPPTHRELLLHAATACTVKVALWYPIGTRQMQLADALAPSGLVVPGPHATIALSPQGLQIAAAWLLTLSRSSLQGFTHAA